MSSQNLFAFCLPLLVKKNRTPRDVAPRTGMPTRKKSSLSAKKRRAARELERCARGPSSQMCRRAVFLSDARLKSGKPSRNRSMTKQALSLDTAGRKVVSKKKSKQARIAYHSGRSGLRAWNEAATRELLRVAASPYDEFEEGVDGTNVPSPYVPFEAG